MAHFCDDINKEDLIESVWKGKGYGLVVDKRFVWISEDELFIELDGYDEDMGDYAFDFKEGKYKVLEFDILFNNQLSTLYHFDLPKEWVV